MLTGLWRDGFLWAEGSDPAVLARDVGEHLAAVRRESPELSADNRAGLRALLELARDEAVPLYLAFGPLEARVAADPGFQAYFESLRAELLAALGGCPNADLVLSEPVTFPAECMQIADHLLGPAAERYTAALLNALGPLVAPAEERLANLWPNTGLSGPEPVARRAPIRRPGCTRGRRAAPVAYRAPAPYHLYRTFPAAPAAAGAYPE